MIDTTEPEPIPALLAAEWSDQVYAPEVGDYVDACPVCCGCKPGSGPEETGHEPDCVLHAAIIARESFMRTLGEVLFDGDGWTDEAGTIVKATEVVEDLHAARAEVDRLKARNAKQAKRMDFISRKRRPTCRSGARIQYRGPIVDLDLRVDGVRRLLWNAAQIGISAWKMRRAA